MVINEDMEEKPPEYILVSTEAIMQPPVCLKAVENCLITQAQGLYQENDR